jgi:ubiquinone/menaquinone biosynthesis C-methylase UbiE
MNNVPNNFVVPEVAVSHFHIKAGDTVADFGAGSGHFLRALSERVGSEGRVYACEIQKGLVEKVSDLARKEGLLNIHPLWCDLEEPNGIKIKDSSVDVGVLVNTLFQLEDRDAGTKETIRTIRQGGRLVVIDWTDSAGGLGPAQGHVISLHEATSLLEAQGLVLEQEFPTGSHHYGVSFRKL